MSIFKLATEEDIALNMYEVIARCYDPQSNVFRYFIPLPFVQSEDIYTNVGVGLSGIDSYQQNRQ